MEAASPRGPWDSGSADDDAEARKGGDLSARALQSIIQRGRDREGLYGTRPPFRPNGRGQTLYGATEVVIRRAGERINGRDALV